MGSCLRRSDEIKLALERTACAVILAQASIHFKGIGSMDIFYLVEVLLA